jgi:tRNA pseudouridine13 synthase
LFSSGRREATTVRLLTRDLPGTGGLVKSVPEDFVVDELPLYTPSGDGPQLLVRVRKRGMTTHEMVQRVAKTLHLPDRDVGFAGIKDSRAVTTQWISVPAAAESRLADLSHPWIAVVETARNSRKLRIGELEGNRFEIVVRSVEPDVPTAVERARTILAELARRGVPNGFGEQRFGTKGDSDLLGRALVQGDAKEALALYLGRPAPSEHDPRILAARRLFDEGKLEEAERSFPPRLRTEAIVLHAFRQHGDPFRALFKIPRRMRLLFLSAYQARVFNRCLEARFETLDRLLDGDVYVRHETNQEYHCSDPAREQPRADRFEISPAGPIFGPGLMRPTGESAAIESEIFTEERLDPAEWRQLFPDLHLRGERRAYRFPLRDASVEAHEHGVVLRFTLPRGSYATNVVAEVTKQRAADGDEGPTASA